MLHLYWKWDNFKTLNSYTILEENIFYRIETWEDVCNRWALNTDYYVERKIIYSIDTWKNVWDAILDSSYYIWRNKYFIELTPGRMRETQCSIQTTYHKTILVSLYGTYSVCCICQRNMCAKESVSWKRDALSNLL